MSFTATCSTISLASGTGQCVTLPGPREQARRVPALSRTSARRPPVNPMIAGPRPVPRPDRTGAACDLRHGGPAYARKKGTGDATQVHAGSPGRRDTRRRRGRRRPGDPVRAQALQRRERRHARHRAAGPERRGGARRRLRRFLRRLARGPVHGARPARHLRPGRQLRDGHQRPGAAPSRATGSTSPAATTSATSRRRKTTTRASGHPRPAIPWSPPTWTSSPKAR